MVLFLAVYTFLMVAWARMVGRFIKEGPVAESQQNVADGALAKEGE